MKNRWMKNLSWKILSLVAAFMFWLLIINVTDPTTAKTFSQIPVEILNDNVITTANQVYEIESGDTIDVTVKGKRSFVETLSDEDFEATADLSELSKVNAVTINVNLKKKTESDYELDAGSAVMKVKLEKRVSKKFRVEIESHGEVGENYELGEMTAKPNIVEVSCGESKFKKIDHVAVIVPLNGETEDFERAYMPVLYDKNGDLIDSEKVTFSNDSISVYTQVLLTKEISVIVKPTGQPAAGYRLLETAYKPESIRISGKSDKLKKQNSVTVPIRINGAKNPVETEVDVSKYLPDGLFVVGDSSIISIRCDIQKNGTKSFLLTETDIAVKNLPPNCTIKFANPEANYRIDMTGKDEILEDLALLDLGAYIDLQGCSNGQNTLAVQFQLPSGVHVKKKVEVSIILERQNGQGSSISSPTDVPSQVTTVPPDNSQ